MNKNAIQKFAVWARKEMIAQVSQRAYQYGITKESYGVENAVTVNGRALSTDEQRQRAELVQQIKIKGYDQVMEEVAYTWFNRFIALRYMEVNNYLPSHIRVFSDASGAFKPEILADVLHLELDGLDKQKVAAYIEQNQTDDLYRYLLLTQCNALNAALPRMFERLGSYTELLLPNNILKADGILGRLVSDIPEEDWHDQVQIIGWLYQYYSSEEKERLINAKKRYKKQDLPFVTQLFTSDWIVRYMVQNTLGRLWSESHPESTLKSEWEFYIEDDEVTAELEKISEKRMISSPEELTLIDPCMGSGHILAYAFDMLMQIYEESGFSQREAASKIVENNLYGLDIDERAAQLAYFEVMMKAREYDRRFFSRGIQPKVFRIYASESISESSRQYFYEDADLRRNFDTLYENMQHADEIGSIIDLKDIDFDKLFSKIESLRNERDIFSQTAVDEILPLLQAAELLSHQYEIVVSNPPYISSKYMTENLSKYIAHHYPDYKADVFAAFIARFQSFCKADGQIGFISPYVWMFIQSYEKLRNFIYDHMNFSSIVQLEYNAFEAACVPVGIFTLRNSVTNLSMVGVKLSDFKGSDVQAPKLLEALQNKDCGYRYTAHQSNFSKIPGSPVAYWVSEIFYDLFKYKKIADYAEPRHGMSTGNNDLCLRLWHEVCEAEICFDAGSLQEFDGTGCRYAPYKKGGDYRLWYGNNDYIIAYSYKARAIMESLSGYRASSNSFFFKPSINWSDVSSSYFGVRISPKGFAFDGRGASLFCADDLQLYLLGLLASKITSYTLNILNPTLTFNINNIGAIPVIIPTNREDVNSIVEHCVNIAISDWDAYETSWDFKQDPIVRNSTWLWDVTAVGATMDAYYDDVKKQFHSPMELAYLLWKGECNHRFKELRKNEEELNRIFIDIYGLQDELTPEVADKDVTVYCIYDTKEDVPESLSGSNYVLTKRDVVVNFISYAVGCMFGRYSLYNDGILYAGGGSGDFGSLVEKIQDHLRAQGKSYFPENEFYPDPDNIIPICDDEYFDDDITGRFVKFVEIVFGEDSLEDNLTFIVDALGGKGTAREIIRNYFLKDFYKDHCRTYKKRPIYWLFDSGKKNGFKALIYMHRYQPDLLARMRTDYVHEQQERYRTQLAHLADAIEQAKGSERVKLTKQQKKLQDQSLEIQQYEEKIHHLADQNIVIDLDDGVKHNYALFADVLAKIK